MTTQQAILERIWPYVPPYWVRQACADPSRSLVGREASFRAVVLFVDISGFTRITETLSQCGPEGIEELSALLDRYFDAMSEPVAVLGGEVFKFAGDSLIVLFMSDEDDLYLGAALLCAIRMQQAVGSFIHTHTLAGSFSLEIKVGISEGPVYTTTVGDEASGMQPVLAGRALVRAMQAEKVAQAGEIVVDAMLTSRLPGRLELGEARGTFRLIDGARDLPEMPACQETGVSDSADERAALLIQRLGPYLAAQVMERIEQGERAVSCEHRCVTAMFVRFGGLALDLMAPGDAENGGFGLSRDGRVLQDYVVAMRDCVQRYGGRLNEVDFTAQGGTLVVFFGAPTAQENDELAAVMCAWEMRQVLVRLLTDLNVQQGRAEIPDLKQCVSISSGTVFVGDVGARIRRTYAVVGDGVNLASRLTGLAQWGEILVSDSVRYAAQEHFVFVSLGEREIRGKAARVPVSRLVEPRQQFHTHSPLSRLLCHPMPAGRASELVVLDDVRERAWQGVPQLLQIVGQAGVGKSCLAGQLADRWLVRGGRVCAGDCSLVEHQGGYGVRGGSAPSHDRPYGRPYGQWVALLRGVFGLLNTDSYEQQKRRIRRELALLSLSGRDAACLEEFALEEAARLPDMPHKRQRLHRSVAELLGAAAAKRPLLLVFEDLHRADDASQDLLRDVLCDLCLVQGGHVPILVCVTGRPTGHARLLAPGYSDLSLTPSSTAVDGHHALAIEATRIILEPLSEAASLSLAQQLLSDAGLDGDLLPVLLRRGGGNPLFIQEMVREWSNAVQAGTATHSELSFEQFVPERVAHVILTQLDPLSEDLKLTLRLAAVIGHSFSFHVLQAAHPTPLSGTELTKRLATLERMHIVRLSHVESSNVHYRFRHPMTQQVIYASLMGADRERFHKAVAFALERVYSAELDSRYERLAEHFRLGKVLVSAIVYSVLAGRSAVKARKVREAMTHYSWAEDMLRAAERIDEKCDLASRRSDECVLGTSERGQPGHLCVRGVRLSVMLERARVLLHLMDIAAAKADLERAVSLAGELADLSLQGKALLAWADILMNEAQYGQAVAVVRRATQCFVALGDRQRQARAWKLQSRIHAALGHSEAALNCIERAGGTPYARYLQTIHLRPRDVVGELDQRLHYRQSSTTDWSLTIEEPVWLAQVAAYHGEWDHALRLAHDGIAAAWALGTPLDVADAKWVLALVLTRIGAYKEACGHLDEAMTAYSEAGWKRGRVSGLWLKGQVQLGLDQQEDAAACFEQALGYGRESHAVQAIVRAQVGLGRLAAGREQWRRAERWCVEARARARQAHLGVAWVEAQAGLARVYLLSQRWGPARVQAAQALASSRWLGFQDIVLESADMLGQAWMGLGEVDRAQECIEEANATAQQLAGGLSPDYARFFVQRRAELERI